MTANKLVLSLAGVATVMAGGAAAYWQFSRVAPDSFSPVALAEVIPQSAYAAAYISTEAQSWSKLEQFGTPAARQNLQTELEKLQQDAMQDSQIDLRKDLAWVGNAMVAVMPPADPASDSDPDLLVVVGIKDKLSALNFAKKLEGQPDTALAQQQYQGTEVNHVTQDGNEFYTAVLKDYLIASPELAAVERAIDTQQGQPSLAAGAGKLLNQTLDLQNSVARFYVLDYAAAMQDLLAASPTPVPATMLTQLSQVKSVVGGIGIDDAGVRLKAQTDLDSAMAVSAKASSGQIVAQFPTETLALVSGNALNEYWAQIVQHANSTSEAQLAVGGMRQAAKTYLNLDVDQELFGWMDGEFALGMVPATQGIFAQVGMGGRMVFETSNRKAAEATLNKLDGLAKQSFVGVTQPKQSVTEWSLPGQGVLLQHGWLDNNSLLITIGGSADQGLKPAESLERSDSFQAATASLPKQNLGYVYLNVEKMLPLLNKTQMVSQSSASLAESAEANAALESIRGIAITSTQPSKMISEVEMLLSLKSAQK
ncbi:MAG: DUF3352 domain-containing protein [Pegethrix bostrychoides GSE-TBD4-15B]|jgi:hypothetical protein|uniref:DUF3352 domain-containing protein n=1 Tax=Pegethrix bostrychoides GSE-TBD4-15B TaxID=2839662 RepID=A0A951PFP9_9CYAN|nr:DUF3352 domain-containing protein [Pegethrix bostrychoides GSE-TBD4-15B]